MPLPPTPGPKAAAEPVTVTLSEFAASPSIVDLSSGATLHVANEGTAARDLTVRDTDLTTGEIAAGAEPRRVHGRSGSGPRRSTSADL